jgi:hypothetical protein
VAQPHTSGIFPQLVTVAEAPGSASLLAEAAATRPAKAAVAAAQLLMPTGASGVGALAAMATGQVVAVLAALPLVPMLA